MLIFISDLHFVDGLAGKHNIPASAFKGAFKDIRNYCRDPEEIKIVFLGDVFDLLRTTYWLDKDESERPWGDIANKKDRIDYHANVIMDKILEENRETFDLFAGNLRDLCEFPMEPERIYIPGNHDRLCNFFDSLRTKARKALGIPASTDPFPHAYDDKQFKIRYGVFARHGHEYDTYNYEGTFHFADIDYEQVPIGDVITTEIAARLPYTILQHVQAKERENLQRNLEEIEDVRPLSAIFEWLFYQVHENSQIKNEINNAVHEIADKFNNLEFVKRWYKRHHDWNILSSQSDKLHAAINMCRLLEIDACEEIVKIFSKIFGSSSSLSASELDQTLIKNAQDILVPTSDYNYVVMGHTHNPLQVPIGITNDGREQVYLNTGTWRQRNIQGTKNSFIGIKSLTYTMFYSSNENGAQNFEVWTGALNE
jgi:UDP-2,3-diacylglucosamine pyrophosphatase LpxH